jgi:hypothetical protein
MALSMGSRLTPTQPHGPANLLPYTLTDSLVPCGHEPIYHERRSWPTPHARPHHAQALALAQPPNARAARVARQDQRSRKVREQAHGLLAIERLFEQVGMRLTVQSYVLKPSSRQLRESL